MNYTSIPKEIWWNIFFYTFDTFDNEFERNKCFMNLAGTSIFWKNITANNKTFLSKYFTKYFNFYISITNTEKTLTEFQSSLLIEIQRYEALTNVLDEEAHLQKTNDTQKQRESDTLAKCVYDINFDVRDHTIEDHFDLINETDKLKLKRDGDLIELTPKYNESFPQTLDVDCIDNKEFLKQMKTLLCERKEKLLFNEQLKYDGPDGIVKNLF